MHDPGGLSRTSARLSKHFVDLWLVDAWHRQYAGGLGEARTTTVRLATSVPEDATVCKQQTLRNAWQCVLSAVLFIRQAGFQPADHGPFSRTGSADAPSGGNANPPVHTTWHSAEVLRCASRPRCSQVCSLSCSSQSRTLGSSAGRWAA